MNSKLIGLSIALVFVTGCIPADRPKSEEPRPPIDITKDGRDLKCRRYHGFSSDSGLIIYLDGVMVQCFESITTK